MLSNVLIDVGLALAALVIGFATAWAYFRHAQASCRAMAAGAAGEANQTAANEAERASMAVDQVRDLTQSVASDVGDHTRAVSDASEALQCVDAAGTDSAGAVAAVVARMLLANERLQTRLEEAEHKIQAQAEEIRAQHSEARIDSLTNLANRRAFDAALEACFNRFEEDRQPFSMILLDIDHFKLFNDTHGHQAGDAVLRAVGRTLQTVVKKTDTPCRYGGEEFAVVMPATNAKQGRIAAERVRQAIERMTVEFEGHPLEVSASVGVAEVAAGEQAPQLIRRADDAVYAAKKAGRNSGYWHDGVECLPNAQESLHTKEKTRAARSRTMDPATDHPALPDAEAFEGELSRRIAESHRFGVTLSVMCLQIEDFPELASNYGEAACALIVDSVAGYIRSTLREMDLLASLSGGRFGVMLPGSNENEARLVGKRIQTAISNCAIPLGQTKLRLEIELGVATVEPNDSAQEMVARAEGRLQRASVAAVGARAPVLAAGESA